MPSSDKLLKAVEHVIQKHPEAFAALEEFDRTGKLVKPTYKERSNFTIDAQLLKEFRAYCKAHAINMSAKIESWIKKELERNGDSHKPKKR